MITNSSRKRKAKNLAASVNRDFEKTKSGACHEYLKSYFSSGEGEMKREKRYHVSQQIPHKTRQQYGRVHRIQQIQRPPPSVVWPLLLHLQVIKYSSHPQSISLLLASATRHYLDLVLFSLVYLLAPLLNSQYGLTLFPFLPDTPGAA